RQRLDGAGRARVVAVAAVDGDEAVGAGGERPVQGRVGHPAVRGAGGGREGGRGGAGGGRGELVGDRGRGRHAGERAENRGGIVDRRAQRDLIRERDRRAVDVRDLRDRGRGRRLDHQRLDGAG